MKNNIYTVELILDILNDELCMYDDLSKNDRYKVDREKACHTWNAIEDIRKQIKNIYGEVK